MRDAICLGTVLVVGFPAFLIIAQFLPFWAKLWVAPAFVVLFAYVGDLIWSLFLEDPNER